jgi:hypothetical protein
MGLNSNPFALLTSASMSSNSWIVLEFWSLLSTPRQQMLANRLDPQTEDEGRRRGLSVVSQSSSSSFFEFYKRYVYIVLSSPAVSGVQIDTGLIAVLFLQQWAADLLSGWNAEKPIEQAGGWADGPPTGAGSSWTGLKLLAHEGELYVQAKSRDSRQQRAGDAQAPAQKTLESALRINSLLKQLKLELPDQPPPKITASGQLAKGTLLRSK